MIIKGHTLPAEEGRKPYPLAGHSSLLRHFVVRVTTPETPFPPHRHDQPELWYIIEGEATVRLDGRDYPVQGGDLIVLEPGVEHGLRTESRVTWICLG